MLKHIVVGIILAIAPFSALMAQAQTTDAQKVEALVAQSKGDKGTNEDVIGARILLCTQAIKYSIPPAQYLAYLKARGLTAEAAQDTLDVCVAFSTGLAVGQESNRRPVNEVK